MTTKRKKKERMSKALKEWVKLWPRIKHLPAPRLDDSDLDMTRWGRRHAKT